MRLPNLCSLTAGLSLALLCFDAFADRPLASDDASTADAGICLVEVWAERAGAQGAQVLAPECGVAPGLEINAALTRLAAGQSPRSQTDLALKWAPKAATFNTGLGDASLGLKLTGVWQRPGGASWQRSHTSLQGLLSWQANPAWAVHANLGPLRDRASALNATQLNLALVWTPIEQLLLFSEAQANDRRAVLGGTVYSAGARWWLSADKLGLDFSASREAGAGGPTRWTLGLGWYGLGR